VSLVVDAITASEKVSDIDNFSVSINSGQLLLGGDVSDRESGRARQININEIIGDKLTVLNNFRVLRSPPRTEEEISAASLQQQLNDIATNAIVFNPNSATLTADAQQVLDRVASALILYPDQVIEISGHTDSRGEPLANMELSRRRAVAVGEYLVNKNIIRNQLRPIGYGETQPIADNSTAEGRAANRRIEFNLELESR